MKTITLKELERNGMFTIEMLPIIKKMKDTRVKDIVRINHKMISDFVKKKKIEISVLKNDLKNLVGPLDINVSNTY